MSKARRKNAEATAAGSSTKKQFGSDIGGLNQTIEEKILRTVYELYTGEKTDETGVKRKDAGGFALADVAANVGVDLRIPRKKVTVMICGNHSSGKSSFVNWYVGETVQKTGVAIETQGVTFVQNGKRRETLQGSATLNLFPYMRDFANSEKGLKENLCVELSISTERKFGLCTFIDTPGLVDGTTQYPFDVFRVMKFFADQADLVFVFFDPIGQALCDRTMKTVKMLNEEYPERLRYFLTKADDVPVSTDLQKVLVQITQNLAPVVRNKNFDINTIYLPSEDKKSTVPNGIYELCKTIEKTINLTVQRTLDDLEKDCEKLVLAVNSKLYLNETKKAKNSRARSKGLLFAFLAAITALIVVLRWTFHLIDTYFRHHEIDAVASAGRFLSGVGQVAHRLSQGNDYFVLYMFGIVVVFLGLSRFFWKQEPTLSRKERNTLLEQSKYINENIKKIRKELYADYLAEVINED